MTLLNHTITGEGLPIVLVHGFPLDLTIWDDVIAVLSKKGRVIALDMPGFGQSKVDAPFTIESLADAIHATLERLNALPCVLGGLSMGGYVALAYAKKYGSALKGLMLIDTRAEADSAEGKKSRDAMIALVKEKGSTAVANQMMPKMLAPITHDQNPHIADRLQAIMNGCPARTIEYACAAMRDREDYTTLLPTIAAPVLVVVGESDVITPPSMAEGVAKALKRSTLAVIKNAGHMSPMERGAEVGSVIQAFVATV